MLISRETINGKYNPHVELMHYNNPEIMDGFGALPFRVLALKTIETLL